MKKFLSFLVLSIISLSLFYKCSNSKNIDLDTLAKAYVDILVVEDYYEGSDSLQFKKNEVYEKYDLDTAAYNSAFRKINYDEEKWNEFFTLANSYLDSLKSNLKK